MSNQILLTEEGYARLKEELNHLKGPAREQNANAIREAKAHGDLRENAAYHEAKLNQTRLDSRIADLERVLQIAKIVERGEGGEGTVLLGSKVKLYDNDYEEEFEIEIVGSFEADAAKGLVSIDSPLGAALMGKAVNDIVEYMAPGGQLSCKVLAVE